MRLRQLRRRDLLLSSRPAPPRRGLRPLLCAAAALFSALLPLQASAAPPSRAERALLHDLAKIVEVRATLGWKIDRYELDAMMPDALQSVCATPESTRTSALARQGRLVDALGGPIEQAFQRNGRSLDGLGDLLAATRVEDLLAEALRRAPTECPFWLLPSSDFIGVQTDAHRLTLNLETDGLLLLRRTENGFLPGGGGGGRLLLGYGLSERWTLLFGGDVAGWALFDQSDAATRFPIEVVAATPLVVRHVRRTWQFDVEAAPVAFLTLDDLRPRIGGRLGGAIGLSSLRIRRIMPFAGIHASVDLFPGTEVRPMTMVIKGGARVGFDWDF